MERIDMKRVLFHGVLVSNPYVDRFMASVDITRSILQSGYIMNRSTLKKMLSENDESNLYAKAFYDKTDFHYGGDDVVSLGCKDMDFFSKYIISRNHNNTSFMFSSGLYLVLDPKVLKDIEVVNISNWQGGVSGEIQIKGNIPASYINAIQLKSRINSVLDNVTKYVSHMSDIDLYALEYMNELVGLYSTSEEACVKKIIDECNYSNKDSNVVDDMQKEIGTDLPIVDQYGDEIILDNQIDKTLSLTKTYRTICNKRITR